MNIIKVAAEMTFPAGRLLRGSASYPRSRTERKTRQLQRPNVRTCRGPQGAGLHTAERQLVRDAPGVSGGPENYVITIGQNR